MRLGGESVECEGPVVPVAEDLVGAKLGERKGHWGHDSGTVSDDTVKYREYTSTSVNSA